MDAAHAIAAAIFLFGSFVQGASGFGSGLVMMGLSPFVLETKDATVIVALLIPVISGYLYWKLRRHATRRRVLPYLVGYFAGQPAGILIFVYSGAAVLKIIIGATLVLFCSYLLLSRREFRLRPDWRLASGAGLAGGVLAGACNTGGPPIVLYVYMQGLEKEETSAILQTIFFAGSLLKVALFAGFGQIAAAHAGWAALYLLFVLAGGALGLVLFSRIDTDRLRRCVYAMLIFVGAALIVTSVRAMAAGA